MAITVNWLTKVINIPKADLTLIQASPEVRELDLDWFRYQLKDIEDSEEGMVFDDTHRHFTEVTLAGLTYARIVEIINGYTIEFEDGQYTINCTGANHNISDVKVANQVSLIVNNAAGLISSAEIQYASFGDAVTINESSGTAGTLFPAGTPQQPVDNWTDALTIAAYYGFIAFNVEGDGSVNGAFDLSDKIISGQSPNKTTLTIDSLASTSGLEIKNATVTGTLDGENYIFDSTVVDLTYVNGSIINCGLIGDISLDGAENAVLNDCFTIDQDDPPVIDMGGSGQSLAMPNYSGLVNIKNLSDSSQEVGVGLNAGMIVLESTISAGTIVVSGVGVCTDNSTGTASVNIDGLVSRETITKASWETVWIDTTNGTSGTAFPLGTKQNPVDNFTDAMSIATSNNVEKIHTHGSITLDQAIPNMLIESHSHDAGSVNLNGQDISDSTFLKLNITGSGTGNTNFTDCIIENGFTNINAHLENCILGGAFTVASGARFNGDRCTSSSGISVDCNGDGSVGFANFSGIMTISNVTDAGASVAVTGYYLLTLASSCTAGTAFFAGTGILNDSSAGMSVTEKTLPGTIADDVWSHADALFLSKVIKNKKVLAKTGSIWELIIYDDDDSTPILQKDLKDINGNDITDIAAGNLAQELSTSV